MNRRAFVLLSGGLDSTTALFLAIHQYYPVQSEETKEKAAATYLAHDRVPIDWVEAISIDYGQRHLKETEYAKRTCERLGISHTTLSLGHLLAGPGVMLTERTIKVPDISYSDIKGVSPTYVPFRNGLMLSAIAAHAQKYVNAQIEAMFIKHEDGGGDFSMQDCTARAKDLCGIYFGAHADDALNWAYPDCTPEFTGAMANAIYTGTYNAIRLHVPFGALDKSQIVEWGTKLGVPYENTWSCYKGEELHCGICPTCRSRKDAFRLANVKDPTEYAA